MKKIVDKFESLSEFICLCFILIVAVYFFIGSFQFSDSDVIFPLLTSSATIICTVIYFVKCIYAKDQKEKKEKADANNNKSVIISALLFIGYLILVWLFGFLIATLVFTLAYPIAMGYRKKGAIAILLVVNTGCVLLFQYLMGISLSRGVLLDLTHLFF